MKSWLKLSLLLSVFGFFKEFRPSEHYIYTYLLPPWRNLTEDQIKLEVYPVATYSYLAQLFIVFLITDLCRYKPLIITLGCSGIIVFAMLIWTTSLVALQIVEVVYGTLMATEVAYYTYMYAKVPKEHYQQVTGHTRAGILIGRFLSGVVAQLLFSYEIMNVKELTYISLGALIIGTIWAIFLPSVPKSIYFHRLDVESTKLSFQEKWKRACNLLYQHFISSYSIAHVVKWSIWWSVSTCGFILVQTYMQPLWKEIKPDQSSDIYNGAVEAALTLLGTLGAISAGFIKTDWTNKGEIVLSICSLIEGTVLLIASQTNELFVAYGAYIIFGALYHFMITIASAEIAKNILEDSYGLVFGMNTFLALLLQTLIIIVVISEGFHLSVARHQYLFYGGYFIFFGIVFMIMGIWQFVKFCKGRRNNAF